MENNGIRDVIVDHFIMKEEIICHICVIWVTGVMKLLAQSVRHWKYDYKIFVVVMATKLEPNEFN